MCMMCDGVSRQQVHDNIRNQIDTRGYAVLGVEDRPGNAAWAYTIGLVQAIDHPELVVTGVDLRFGSALLDEVAARVVCGERFHAGSSTVSLEGEVGFVAVHPHHIRHGLLDGWLPYYDDGNELDIGPTALQILVPDSCFCVDHKGAQPRLDTDDPSDLMRPNRATRRASRSRARRRQAN